MSYHPEASSDQTRATYVEKSKAQDKFSKSQALLQCFGTCKHLQQAGFQMGSFGSDTFSNRALTYNIQGQVSLLSEQLKLAFPAEEESQTRKAIVDLVESTATEIQDLISRERQYWQELIRKNQQDHEADLKCLSEKLTKVESKLIHESEVVKGLDSSSTGVTSPLQENIIEGREKRDEKLSIKNLRDELLQRRQKITKGMQNRTNHDRERNTVMEQQNNLFGKEKKDIMVSATEQEKESRMQISNLDLKIFELQETITALENENKQLKDATKIKARDGGFVASKCFSQIAAEEKTQTLEENEEEIIFTKNEDSISKQFSSLQSEVEALRERFDSFGVSTDYSGRSRINRSQVANLYSQIGKLQASISWRLGREGGFPGDEKKESTEEQMISKPDNLESLVGSRTSVAKALEVNRTVELLRKENEDLKSEMAARNTDRANSELAMEIRFETLKASSIKREKKLQDEVSRQRISLDSLFDDLSSCRKRIQKLNSEKTKLVTQSYCKSSKDSCDFLVSENVNEIMSRLHLDQPRVLTCSTEILVDNDSQIASGNSGQAAFLETIVMKKQQEEERKRRRWVDGIFSMSNTSGECIDNQSQPVEAKSSIHASSLKNSVSVTPTQAVSVPAPRTGAQEQAALLETVIKKQEDKGVWTRMNLMSLTPLSPRRSDTGGCCEEKNRQLQIENTELRSTLVKLQAKYKGEMYNSRKRLEELRYENEAVLLKNAALSNQIEGLPNKTMIHYA